MYYSTKKKSPTFVELLYYVCYSLNRFIHYFCDALARSVHPTLPTSKSFNFHIPIEVSFQHTPRQWSSTQRQEFSTVQPCQPNILEHHRVCLHLWLSIRCLCDFLFLRAVGSRQLSQQTSLPMKDGFHCRFLTSSTHSGTLYFTPRVSRHPCQRALLTAYYHTTLICPRQTKSLSRRCYYQQRDFIVRSQPYCDPCVVAEGRKGIHTVGVTTGPKV